MGIKSGLLSEKDDFELTTALFLQEIRSSIEGWQDDHPTILQRFRSMHWQS